MRAIQPHLGPFDDYCKDDLFNILEIKRLHHCVFVHMDCEPTKVLRAELSKKARY